MKLSRTQVFLIVLTVALFVSSCASVPKRNPLPDDFEGIAQIPGMPEKVRMWGDEPPPFVAEWNVKSRTDLQAEFGGVMGREHNYLAISGGGQQGAFGAGLMAGWAAAGTRPEFTIVTGISTGALIAPFAFLGPSYDKRLREVYSAYSTDDLIKKRGIVGAVTSDGYASTEPLKGLISKYYDKQVIDAIAAEFRKGRVLFIGTTDLETDRPVIWSITRIAASGHPKAPGLIHKVLLASASIPVMFPPVIIEVEVKGQRYDEMHVDGGTSTQIFLYPVGVKWDVITEKLEVKGRPNVFLIHSAVKGACDNVVLDNLTMTLARLKAAVKAVPGYDSDRTSKNKRFVQAVADKHVEQSVERIRRRSPILWGMINNGQIGLVGAMYNVQNGKVTFM